MSKRITTRLGLIVLMLALVGGWAQGAAAQTGPLPTLRQPTSERFDLTGTITSSSNYTKNAAGNLTIHLSGSGATVGTDRAQVDLSVDLGDLGLPGGSTIPPITESVIQIGQTTYIKSGNDPQWYYSQVTTTTGSGLIPGMSGTGMMGMNPADLGPFLAAFQIQQVGKETINGAATTKYQINVDLKKLYDLLGMNMPSDPTTAQALQNSKLVMYLWTGDDDMYLHQFRITLDTSMPNPDGSTTSLNLDLTATFHDFGTAITIAAPPNAVPLEQANIGGGAGVGGGVAIIGGGTLAGGMAGVGMLPGMPTIVQMPATTGGAMPGMPKSGVADFAGGWALLAGGLACLLLGGWLRRRSALLR